MGANVNIKVHGDVAEKFRQLSPKIAKTHSKALTLLMDAYKKSSATQKDVKSHPVVKLLLERSDTNANRIIALIRKIEGDQINQTLGMIKVLFGYSSEESGPNQRRTSTQCRPKKPEFDFDKAFSAIDLKEENIKLAAELRRTRTDIHTLLTEKTKVVRPLIGKQYIELLVTPEDLEALITKFQSQT